MARVLCTYCDLPGTFYMFNYDGKNRTKVTDPLLRITTNRGAKAIYAHQHCHKIGTIGPLVTQDKDSSQHD